MRVNTIEDFWSPDDSRKLEIGSFRASSSMGDDLVIKDPSMHINGPVVGSSHSSTKYQ